MKQASILKAVYEAHRFLDAAKAQTGARKRLGIKDADTWGSTGKQNGALKRASMDLTRALAEMRRA